MSALRVIEDLGDKGDIFMKVPSIKKEHIIQIAAVFIIGILCCVNLTKLNFVAVLNDEFGYWGNAALLAGYDWSDLVVETPYYSMGYSIWLIPIILLSSSPEIWYKMAILLNAAFLVASYFLCCNTARRFFPKINYAVLCGISLLVVIYPGNIVYAQVAWSESLQYMVFWAITCLIVQLDEKYSFKKIIGIIALLVYLYCVHARNIIIVLVALLCLLLVLIKNKQPIRYYILAFLVLVIGYFAIEMVKEYQLTVLWNNSEASDLNNIGLNSVTFSSYFQRLLNYGKLFIESLGGKLIFLIIGSGMTIGAVFVQVASDTWKNLKSKKYFNDMHISKLWCVCSVIAMWAATGLQMIQWTTRKDYIVYSRYIEQSLGPILLLGLMYILLNVSGMKLGTLIAAGVFALGFRSIYYRIMEAESYFNSICSPVIGAFYDTVEDKAAAFINISSLIILYFIVIMGISYLKKNNYRVLIMMVVFGISFSVIGYKGSTYMNTSRESLEANTFPIKEEIQQNVDKTIYYVLDAGADEYSKNPKFIQFMIPDRTIHVIQRRDLKDVCKEDAFILTNPGDDSAVNYLNGISSVTFIASTSRLNLYECFEEEQALGIEN